jgi:hypothetical protein
MNKKIKETKNWKRKILIFKSRRKNFKNNVIYGKQCNKRLKEINRRRKIKNNKINLRKRSLYIL